MIHKFIIDQEKKKCEKYDGYIVRLREDFLRRQWGNTYPRHEMRRSLGKVRRIQYGIMGTLIELEEELHEYWESIVEIYGIENVGPYPGRRR